MECLETALNTKSGPTIEAPKHCLVFVVHHACFCCQSFFCVSAILLQKCLSIGWARFCEWSDCPDLVVPLLSLLLAYSKTHRS